MPITKFGKGQKGLAPLQEACLLVQLLLLSYPAWVNHSPTSLI